MVVSVAKKKSKTSEKLETQQCFFCRTLLIKILYRIPVVILVLMLIFLWSSSITSFSGNIVRVCMSSRKLNNFYCLSTGTQPNFEIPVDPPDFNNDSISTSSDISPSIEEIENIVLDDPTAIIKANVGNDADTQPNFEIQVDPPGFNNDSIPTSADVSPSIEEIVNVVRDDPTAIIKANVGNDANTQPNFEIPVDHPGFNNDSIPTSADVSPSIEEIVNVVRDDPTAIIKANVGNDADAHDEVAIAKKAVQGYVQTQRSWKTDKNQEGCDGRGIYVHDLPTKFNKDLVGQCGDMVPWSTDFCKFFKNDALGEAIPELGERWYYTHQYSLEMIFHSRVLKHPCRVYNENEAKLFYVPFYGGLDILRWHFRNVSNDVKDTLSLELLKWLESRKPWIRNSGKDHVFVLGKISWDFRRTVLSWGTRLLELEQMQNPIKLLIERQPWRINDIGIPHPTYFHPHSDDDIIAWQIRILRRQRKSLVSFAGAARPDQPMNIRSILINQCLAFSDIGTCRFLNCREGGCDHPKMVMELFMDSEFCLQPPGDSPTRKSVFDSLISGCIPVLFDPFTAYYQYPWHLPEDHGKYSAFIDQEEVRQMKVNAVEKLMNISVNEREKMRKYIIYELLPQLVYGDSNSHFEKFQDSFSVAINSLLERVNRLD